MSRTCSSISGMNGLAKKYEYSKIIQIYSSDQSWANECQNIFVGLNIQRMNVQIYLLPKNPTNIC